MLVRQIKRQTVPFYLRWIPATFLPHIDAAIARAQIEDGCPDCPRYRPHAQSWAFIMPFDLEHYIEDHSTSGDHKHYG